MITILKTDIQKFTHILHIADIHIRLNKRHDEYKEVFDELYNAVKNTPDTTIVAILGDVFHSKSELSPECIQMAYDLFTNLTKYRPVILIAGNHDATLSNKSRLDSLTPIVDALNISNLYYLKDTGLYGLGNVLFNNMGVFDHPDKYVRGKDIPSIYRNQYERIVALFHGPVDGAATDTGYRINNPSIMTPLFDHHDIALLGDIHRSQNLYIENDESSKIRFCGSMIQQNHGESLNGHGYSLWNLDDNSYVHHELKNKCGYFTIEIHKGQLVTGLDDLPEQVRLRVKCFDTIATEVKSVVATIKSKSDVIETSYVRVQQDIDDKKLIPICTDIVLNDLSNVDYQEKLISEYLEKKNEITDRTRISDILKINRSTNTLIKRDEFSRNLKWKPIRFEFDNMFTYGEGNVIDFTKMNGVYGIFGPNKVGKSSLLSAMSFCLFDKFDRGFKGILVRNAEKSSFTCKFEFEISEVRYFIERTGETTRSGNVKVNVEFWKVVDGKKEELHGTARRDTNDVIRDYIGSYEDFILTTLSVQTAKNNISFIDMGNTERKDLLVQFIGLNIFDRLYDVATERNKELNTLLKVHKDKNYSVELNNCQLELTSSQTIFDNKSEIIESLHKQLSEVNEQIIIETKNLIKLEDGIPNDLTIAENKKISIETSIRQKKKNIEELQLSIKEKDDAVSNINDRITKIESSDFIESHKTYKTLLTKISDINNKCDLKRVEIRGKLEKVEILKNHKYDPNCKYCIDNSFVKDASNAQVELANDKLIVDKLMGSMNSVKSEIIKYQWVEKTYDTYTKLLTDKSKVKDEFSNLIQKNIISKNELEKLEYELKLIIQQIDLYHRNEISVKHNVKINSIIASYHNTIIRLNTNFQLEHKSLMETGNKIATLKSKIQELNDIITSIGNLEYESFLYKNYMDAVGRDGIPYQVICNIVPELENEINSILTQIVDYTIELETDGKNVNPYIVYDQRKWPIEMASGFERFIASIAIRIALSEISNLPKSNNLQIDEGFGTLDSNNMASMSILFSFLKSRFDFILVVSHIDALKDAVDHQIEIKQEGNFSKVNFE